MERNNNELPSSFNYHFSFNNKTTYDISHKFFRGLNQKNTVSTTETVFYLPNIGLSEHLTSQS